MIDVMDIPVLAELETRAGASDQDRALWLAERASGVTATQVRDLYIGAVKAQDLIDVKLGRKPDPFVRSRYTEWGLTREPFLAERANIMANVWPESRVFHAVQDARWLASPDGVGIDFDELLTIGEYKTSKYPIPLGSEHIEKVGYVAQMVWQMHVTGARRCLYIWEQHNDDWQKTEGELFPQPTGIVDSGREWVEYDPVLAANLERIAVEFLAEMDRQAEEGAPAIDELLDTKAVNYLRFLSEESSVGSAKSAEFTAIKELLSGFETFRQESPLARITWTRGGSVTETQSVERVVADAAAAKEAHGDVWAAAELARKRADEAEREALVLERAWAEVLVDFTTSSVVEEQVTRSVRPNLRITSPKIKEMN